MPFRPEESGPESGGITCMRINGIEINVQVRGSGQPLVLLHPTTGAEVKHANEAFIREQAEAGLMLTPEQAMAASRAMGGPTMEGFDFRPLLPRVTARTLVISGRHDPLHPPEEGQELAELIPGAQFVVMERSGHVPNLEEPERFLALVDAFLRD